jgi:PAS domain S-box-containing protein
MHALASPRASIMSDTSYTQTQADLAALIATLGVGVFALDAHGVLRHANERALRALGVDTEADALGRPLAELAEPSQAQSIHDSLRAARRGYRVRIPWVGGDGSSLVFSPSFDRTGAFDGVSAHVVEGGRAERALARARAELQTLQSFFDSSVEGLALMGPDYRIERANDAFCALVGRTREDLRGRGLFSLARENGVWADELTRARGDLESRGSTDPIEGDYTRGDGSVVPLDVRAWRVYDPGSRAERIMAIARDASTRRRAARRARNDERVAVARERFGLDERAAGVALALATDPDPAHLTLLEYASARAHIVTTPTHVGDLGVALRDTLLGQLDDPHVLSLEGSSTRTADVDAQALQVAFGALLENALISSDRYPEVTLRVGDVDVDRPFVDALSHPHTLRPGPHAFVELTDHGHGMTHGVLGRCVELFYSTRDSTGLGLAAVNAIAYAHGGALHVASAPGQGTTVSIVLPTT